MEIKMEGRQVDLGDPIKDKITERFKNLDKRFGPITHARLSVEKKAHNNDQRAEVKAVVNITGSTITAKKEMPTVLQAVNETLDTLTLELKSHVEKTRKSHR